MIRPEGDQRHTRHHTDCGPQGQDTNMSGPIGQSEGPTTDAGMTVPGEVGERPAGGADYTSTR
jgi:hypothetical protein